MGSSRTQLYSKVINQSYNLQGQRQTWKVILSGTITYNANTGKIYSASTPSLSLYDVSGIHENYDARLTKVTTSRRIYSSKVLFNASYSLRGLVHGHIPGTNLGSFTMLEIGPFSVNFYGYPH